MASPSERRAAVESALADALERRHVAHEVLAVLEERERRWLTPKTPSGRCAGEVATAPPPYPVWRPTALSFAHVVSKSCGGGDGCWFEVVQMLSALSDTALWWSFTDSPEVLFTSVAAACSLAARMADASTGTFEAAACATAWSTSSGGGSVSVAAIRIAQQHLLGVGAPGLCAPTPATWLSAYAERFDVATNGLLARSLDTVIDISVEWAKLFYWRLPPSQDWPPRIVALGAFSLALVVLGFAPADELRPEGLSGERWANMCGDLLILAQYLIQRAAPRGAPHLPRLPPALALAVLQFVAGCGGSLLLSSVGSVAEVLADVAASHVAHAKV